MICGALLRSLGEMPDDICRRTIGFSAMRTGSKLTARILVAVSSSREPEIVRIVVDFSSKQECIVDFEKSGAPATRLDLDGAHVSIQSACDLAVSYAVSSLSKIIAESDATRLQTELES